MDILAARKKAAERARARKDRVQEQPSETAVPAPEPARVRPVEAAEVPQPAPQPQPEPAPAPPVVLEERIASQAAVPAAEPAAGSSDTETQTAEQQLPESEMLSFRLGQEEYVLLVEDVKEVLKNRDLTEVPNAPDYILGVTSLRGNILPVIDLSRRLGVPAGVRDEKSRILVVTLHDEDFGILVDRVAGVVRIRPDSVRPVPDTIEHGAEYLKGITRKDDRLYILLDKEKALGA